VRWVEIGALGDLDFLAGDRQLLAALIDGRLRL
jgi:hypothetical protein